jgi:hypothetical protein
MATVLLTWELGGGLGHLVNILPVARNLIECGYRVVAVLKDLSQVHKVFKGLDIQCLQAPVIAHPPANLIDPVRSFAQLLSNVGFSEPDELKTMAWAWRNLYEYIRPDLIIFDHSPIALLAARACPARKALIGTGFFCPLDQHPLADFRPEMGDAGDRLRHDEDRVLGCANDVLTAWRMEPLEYIARLYHEVDEHFLVTFPELDHYGFRPSTRYWGAWPNVGGKKPSWPKGQGKRIYAYLKNFPALPHLLSALNDMGCPTIVYGDRLDKLRPQFESESMCFEREWLDLAEVGRECDAAILNGNHGTTVSLLLAGRPTLQMPLFLEQGIFSAAVERIDAGLVALPSHPDTFHDRLASLLSSSKYQKGAMDFARRYTGFSPDRQIEAILRRIEEILSV